MQEQHHFFGHILRVSPAGIVILHFDGRISDVNPAAKRMLGFGSAALVGKRPKDVGSPLADAVASLAPGGRRSDRIEWPPHQVPVRHV